MVHAGQLWRQQQETGASVPDGECQPLIVKEVEQDGKVILVVAGQSTLPQTVFNSTNVIIGVGLLSLPMGIKYAGWLCGMVFLLLSAVVTAYTARLLAKCMDVDVSLITFADLAFISYGQKARIATSVLFALELLAACVALIVLFADTLDLLIPGVGVVEWKILCGLLLIPLNFAPLKLLSFSSVVGIFSCFCIVLIVFIDGFTKPHTPGSLREPAETYLFPSNWLTLPLSFGLLMSPWGGHSVFPNLYRDMRHPLKFKKAVKATFTFTYLLDCATAVAGILMFGDGIMDEITANIISTSSYPRFLSIVMSIFIAIIPLTKVPLNARPIVSTLEILSGLDARTTSDNPVHVSLSSYTRGILKFVIRVVVVVIFVIIAIIFPAFDTIMAFMGSTLCFTICVILPLLFYLKIFGKEVSMRERILDYFLIFICSILTVVGTVWAFLPKSMIGAK
jgi:vesicular inhibitory amino acid transporter